MDTFNISSIEDLQSLPKKINDIFDDILTTNLELGMYDESQEQLIKDVINNKEVFKKQIDDYLRNFSIIKKNTEESEEQEREERELGDNPDNTWDKESYTISKKPMQLSKRNYSFILFLKLNTNLIQKQVINTQQKRKMTC